MKSSLSLSLLLGTSCWYKPTPIPSCGIFNNSTKGSWSLLPIETGVLSLGVKLRNSSCAMISVK